MTERAIDPRAVGPRLRDGTSLLLGVLLLLPVIPPAPCRAAEPFRGPPSPRREAHLRAGDWPFADRAARGPGPGGRVVTPLPRNAEATRCDGRRSYLVRPLAFVPTDFQDYFSDGRMAAFLGVAVGAVRSFYAANDSGRTFRSLPLEVVAARHDRAYYWRGPKPNFEYQVLLELQERGYPVDVDWDRFPPDRVVCVFAMGGGGWAGARQYPTGGGFAMVGDAVVLAGMDRSCDRIREEDARKICLDSWLPSGHIYGFGVGAVAHELGHAFGLPHPPDGSPDWPRTVMGQHWNYPETGLSDRDRSMLAASCFFE